MITGFCEVGKVLKAMEKQRGTAKPLCSVQSSSRQVGSPGDTFSGSTDNPFTPPIYVVHILWSSKFLPSKLLREVQFVKVHWQFFFLNFIVIVDIITDVFPSSFPFPTSTHPPFPLVSTSLLSVSMSYTHVFCGLPLTCFHPASPHPSTLRPVSLFLVSVLLSLFFCSLVCVMLGPPSSSCSPVYVQEAIICLCWVIACVLQTDLFA